MPLVSKRHRSGGSENRALQTLWDLHSQFSESEKFEGRRVWFLYLHILNLLFFVWGMRVFFTGLN